LILSWLPVSGFAKAKLTSKKLLVKENPKVPFPLAATPMALGIDTLFAALAF